MSYIETKRLKEAMQPENRGVFNSLEWLRISRALTISRRPGRRNTRDEDAVRAAMNAIKPEEGGEKSE